MGKYLRMLVYSEPLGFTKRQRNNRIAVRGVEDLKLRLTRADLHIRTRLREIREALTNEQFSDWLSSVDSTITEVREAFAFYSRNSLHGIPFGGGQCSASPVRFLLQVNYCKEIPPDSIPFKPSMAFLSHESVHSKSIFAISGWKDTKYWVPKKHTSRCNGRALSANWSDPAA
ncbi:hypothetical protein DFH07DRAFT_767840 [Mycena maculata]|uniref:Uncharacterized protein n=1 Tax=Mycena maculata TaxID=230809 RepID=A0AAD7NS50_9AGAR|nr:hypothetical protein DFH07DRAFT_767840 [Mycena maculata]